MAPGANDIRYVCLSDMHLGAAGSLLTNVQAGSATADPLNASPVLRGLVDCLRYLVLRNEDQVSKPTLILLGDILELALADDSAASMVFWRFLEFAMPPGHELFGEIIYVPGNHDHHLWESARETQYVINYLAKTKPSTRLANPWHTTNIFMLDDPNPVPSFSLNALLHRYDHLKDLTINTAYPNFALMQGQRGVIFHHGHFIESIYQLMTTLNNLIFPERKKETRKIWDIEAENFAWIDFFWSTLGRSGDVGQNVEIIYDKMQDKEKFRELIKTLASGLLEKYSTSDVGEWIGSKVTNLIIDGLVDKLVNPERTLGEQRLSPDAEQGLQDYVNGPLQVQIVLECAERRRYFPREVTFVFGHTHKPFEEVRKFGAYLGDGTPVYNTGGWVVETVDPAALHGGAAVLLNDNLDVTSLRFYNEADGPVNVEVHEEPAPGQGHSDFFTRLKGLVQPDQDPWSQFRDTVVDELHIREENLKDKINS